MDPNSMSFDGMNWLGLGLAMLCNIVIGFVWYAKWFPTGRAWMRHMGMDPDRMEKPRGGAMAASMGMMLIGTFLLWFVITHDFWVYKDAYQNVATGGKLTNNLSIMDGVMAGVFTTLGFVVPFNLNRVAFERMKWGLFGINVGYYFVTLVLGGIILVSVGSFNTGA